MLKHVCLSTACLLGSSLAAETIGSVEFQFPPSNNEWKVLVDDNILENNPFFDDTDEEDFEISADYQWGTPLDDEDDLASEPSRFKVFTHREGDALEIFIAYQDNSPEYGDEDDDEIDSIETAQKQIDEAVGKFLPNHRFVLNSVVDNDDDGFGEWELNDGTQDIMHGYTRVIRTRLNDEVTSVTILGYMTTSLLTEYNRSVWTNALNQAKISN